MSKLVRGVPCSMGCQGHVSHPCEKCGRLAAGMISLSKTSPALTEQSGSYPARWHGRVPKVVRMLETVRADLPFMETGGQAVAWKDAVYHVRVNSHGAVSVILDEGYEKVVYLGVKPGEYAVMEWHDKRQQALSVADDEADELDEALRLAVFWLDKLAPTNECIKAARRLRRLRRELNEPTFMHLFANIDEAVLKRAFDEVKDRLVERGAPFSLVVAPVENKVEWTIATASAVDRLYESLLGVVEAFVEIDPDPESPYGRIMARLVDAVHKYESEMGYDRV